MISFGTRVSGEARRRALGDLGEKAPYYKGEWMETGDDPLLSPTVFLIEQPAGSVLPTHFHRQNEFQVVVQGHGSIGQHGLAPISIHYAGAYSGYGPVTAGPEGLAYFTLRPAFDNRGALTLDKARSDMVRGPKRQAYAEHFTPSTVQALESTTSLARQMLLPSAPDGLAVHRTRVPPHQSIDLDAARECAGVFHMIVGGTAELAGRPVGLWETVFACAQEERVRLVAGAQGTDLVSMFMPNTAPEYRRPRVPAGPSEATAS